MCYLDTTILHDVSQINHDVMRSSDVLLPTDCISWFLLSNCMMLLMGNMSIRVTCLGRFNFMLSVLYDDILVICCHVGCGLRVARSMRSLMRLRIALCYMIARLMRWSLLGLNKHSMTREGSVGIWWESWAKASTTSSARARRSFNLRKAGMYK